MVDCFRFIQGKKCKGKYVFNQNTKRHSCNVCGDKIDDWLYEVLLAAKIEIQIIAVPYSSIASRSFMLEQAE